MFGKGTKAIAIDKRTKESYQIDMICFPLGKPSGKDISVICKEDAEVCEWMSIDEVDIYLAGVDLGKGNDFTAIDGKVIENK